MSLVNFIYETQPYLSLFTTEGWIAAQAYNDVPTTVIPIPTSF